jgi:hypothetical protein
MTFLLYDVLMCDKKFIGSSLKAEASAPLATTRLANVSRWSSSTTKELCFQTDLSICNGSHHRMEGLGFRPAVYLILMKI